MTPEQDFDWPTPDNATLRGYVFGNPDAPADRRIVIVCGAFLPALVYAPFASALAKNLDGEWAVYVYDRRGKGQSSPIDDAYGLDTEVSDVATVLDATGARHIMGHSLGGAVVLQAVRAFNNSDDSDAQLRVPETTVLYDPAITVDESVDESWVTTFQQRANQGQWARAMALVERHLGMSSVLSRAPSWMVTAVLALTQRTPLRRFVKATYPAGAAELAKILAHPAEASDFSGMQTDLVLMTGERSAAYFHATALTLHEAIPDARLVVSPKGVHGSIPAVRHHIVESLALVLRNEPLGPLDVGQAALPVNV